MVTSRSSNVSGSTLASAAEGISNGGELVIEIERGRVLNGWPNGFDDGLKTGLTCESPVE